MAVRKQVTQAQLGRWPKATKAEKSEILDTICAVTGWHRDHARKVIRSMLNSAAPTTPPPAPRVARYTYDADAVALLARCWAILDGPTGKRLRPALPQLLASLSAAGKLQGIEPQVVDQVLAMSPATIDRRLAEARAGLGLGKGRSWTKPGSMLKSSIPLRTWAEWDDTTAGFLQIDLVGHDGGDNNDAFHFTLDATDVATGWTQSVSVPSKGERIVATALEQLCLAFPFHIAGIHSDNGSEFINHHLARWCTTRQITFTRGRATRSNDQAHIEQKNWSVVRRAVGYYRYDTPRELDLLNQLWPLENLLVNLFLPQQKLISKTRHGAKVIKRYDTAATPWTRLTRDHPTLLDPIDHATITSLLTTTDPEATRHQIADLQANLIHLAKLRGTTQRRAKRNHVYLSKTKISPPPTRAKPDESTNPTTRAS